MAQIWTDLRGDDLWTTDGNWAPGPAPDSPTVDAEITIAGPATIDPSASLAVDRLKVDVGASLTVSGTLNAQSAVNDGTLVLGGGTVSIAGSQALSNAGTLVVGSGSTAPVIGSNAGGTIDVAGGTVTLGPGWAGDGRVVETAGTLILSGTYTTAEVLAIQRTGGALILDGTLDNTGATLDLHDIAGAVVGGKILGGTVVGTGADVTWQGVNGPAFLTSAVVQGTVDLGSGYVDLYSITNQGTITGENSITDVLDGQWHNAGGTVTMTNTPLFLAGSFTSADLGTINSDGRVYFNGTWDLQGGTFDAANLGSLHEVIDYGGTFESGTIANSQDLEYRVVQGGHFHDVTLAGGIASGDAGSPYYLTIDGGSRVVPASDGTYVLYDNYGYITVDQDLTFGGAVASFDGVLVIGAGDTFTLAAGGTFYGNQGAAGAGTFVNYGTVVDNNVYQSFDTTFVNHGIVEKTSRYGDTYGGVSLTGATTNAADGTIDDNGSITGTLVNDGLITADQGILVVAGATGAGAFAITGSGILHLQSGTEQAIDFLAATGTLVLDDPGTQAGAITMQAGDVVDLANLTFASGGTVATSGDTVTVTVGGISEALTVVGASAQTFGLAQDAASGTDLTFAACYARGTPILTDRGERAVEDLGPGDLVVTSEGMEPVRWIGHRSYAGAFIAGNHLVLPVTFRAGSLGAGLPCRDLCVSPGHAMIVDGCLVPAWRLVNGVSVVQAAAVNSVSYYHVELGRHAVIFASGAAAESFLDDGCRGQFHNAAEFARLHPQTTPMKPMAARLEAGFALQSMQERIAARAGIGPQPEPAGALHGFVDATGGGRACGWAQDADSPEEAVALEIQVGGHPVLSVLANTFRADLRQAGIGSGCHAFDAVWDSTWTGRVEVRRACDGVVLAPTAAALMAA